MAFTWIHLIGAFHQSAPGVFTLRLQLRYRSLAHLFLCFFNQHKESSCFMLPSSHVGNISVHTNKPTKRTHDSENGNLLVLSLFKTFQKACGFFILGCVCLFWGLQSRPFTGFCLLVDTIKLNSNVSGLCFLAWHSEVAGSTSSLPQYSCQLPAVHSCG